MLGAGVVSSLGLFWTMRGWEQNEMDEHARDLAHEQVEKLQVSVLRSMEVLYSVASLHASEGRLARRQFHQFVQQALARQPELQALSWNPIVPESRREEFEAEAAAEGVAGFQFRQFRQKDSTGNFQPAGRRDEYVPVYFIEPLVPNLPALGFDLGSEPERLTALVKARDTAKPVATPPVMLAQAPDNQAGLLVILPIYSAKTPVTVAERRASLAGFAVAVFRLNDLVGGEFRELRRRGVEAQLYDHSPSGQLVYAGVGPAGAHPAVEWLEVASRRWAVVFWPRPEFAAAQSRVRSRLSLAGGLGFTFLVAAYGVGDWRRNKAVAAANAALQEEVAVRKRTEAAAAAASEAKSGFLASMSHEIRTPLNAILGYTQLMQRDQQLSADQREALSSISASGGHLLGLVNEILDFSKIEAGRMELNPMDFDLECLVGDLAATFRPLCAQKKIRFRAELAAAGRALVHGDEGKLRQILINLIGNAVKFTPAGEVVLFCQPSGPSDWLFEVVDTGPGKPTSSNRFIKAAAREITSERASAWPSPKGRPSCSAESSNWSLTGAAVPGSSSASRLGPRRAALNPITEQ